MEKKNTVLLTVIAVATLLVAVVGATFAYYTATTSAGTNTKGEVTTQTATVGGTSVDFVGTTKVNKIDYPGGIAVIEGKVTAKKAEGNTDKETYKFTYKLTMTGSAGELTGVKWALYESDTPVEIDDSACHFISHPENTSTHFYYNTTGEKYSSLSEITSENKDCNTKNIYTSLSSPKQSGEVGTTELTDATEVTGEITGVNSTDGKSKYYYLVLEYPNQNSNQTETDKGKTISASLSLDAESVSSEIVKGA